jgi:DNA gyrase subunit A
MDNQQKQQVNIEDEMRRSYLDYAMSVIIGRALPDVRDGLKPVHRRILYSMNEKGLTPGKPYKKSANVVGDVLGAYHPHGDTAVYDSMVRMAQDFSMRYPLIDGQGNWGCFTGDTKIKLLDGTERAFAELAQLPPDEIFFVYSVDASAQIVVGEGRYSRVTRRNAELVELTFDDGSTVRCTPDHKFMLRDGGWKQAQELTINDSLMAGEFDTEQVTDVRRIYLRGRRPQYGATDFLHQLEYVVLQEQELLDRLGGELREKLKSARMKSATAIGSLARRHGALGQMQRVVSVQNRRVLSVRRLEARADVYDITVNERHNFTLANGCVVHNSVDGDAAAAYRYTEARLTRIATEMLADIEKETVKFVPNYDESRQEPTVLPTRVPNLLVNGSDGIAVGMATKIPPHNLGEIIEATVQLLQHPNTKPAELIKLVPGPDFPTGGIIYGREGIKQAYETGRGVMQVRARAAIDRIGRGAQERDAIVITEIPFQVNKAKLIEHMAELVNDKKVEGISEIRDETDRESAAQKKVRIVVELKRDAVPQIILNKLYKMTQMQISFGMINLSIVNGQPRVLNLIETLSEFIAFRREVVRNRTMYELKKAKLRAHILEGLKKAIDIIDEIIKLIRASKSTDDAKQGLINKFKFSEIQAQAILDMQLRRLAALERQKIIDEYEEVIKLIAELEEILANERALRNVIVKELRAVQKDYADERRTQIVDSGVELTLEDLIADEDVVITLTHSGYVKRTPLTAYRAQRRGGSGRKGMSTRAEDVVSHIFIASTHSYLMVFTTQGQVYKLKVHEIPDATAAGKGKAIVNLINLPSNEKIAGVIPVREFAQGQFAVMVTRQGVIKKTELSEFANIRSNGIIAMGVDEGDELMSVELTDGRKKIFLATHEGMAICFEEEEVRDMGRQARGVRGVTLRDDDYVVSVVAVDGDEQMLSVTSHGFGKQTPLSEYRVQSRGGKGVINIKTTEKNGKVVAVMPVTKESELLIITSAGKLIRLEAEKIRATGRSAQGVKLIDTSDGDLVASASLVEQQSGQMAEEVEK